MNILMYSLLLIVIVPFQSYSKTYLSQNDSGGIYLTSQDYMGNKLSYGEICGKQHKIKLNDFWGKNYITIKHNDSTYKLQKDSIYAYVGCDGKIFRFYNDYSGEYEIKETKVLTIYLREVYEGNGKEAHLVNHFYFSITPDGKILELTLANVKNSFPQNHNLHDKLDIFFHDANIAEYDAMHGMYKVNHVLSIQD